MDRRGLFEFTLVLILLCVSLLWLNSLFVKPIDKEAYGHATWIYLHGQVESLPADATKEMLEQTINIIHHTFQTYACIECRMQILKDMTTYPLAFSTHSTKEKIRHYLFLCHNRVNQQCQKSMFTPEAYRLQWSNINQRTGAFRCKECGVHQ